MDIEDPPTGAMEARVRSLLRATGSDRPAADAELRALGSRAIGALCAVVQEETRRKRVRMAGLSGPRCATLSARGDGTP